MFENIDMKDIACLTWGFGEPELPLGQGFFKVLIQMRRNIRPLAAIHINQFGSFRIVRQAQVALMKSGKLGRLRRLLVHAARAEQDHDEQEEAELETTGRLILDVTQY